MQKRQLPGVLVSVLLLVAVAGGESRRVDPHFSSTSLSVICRDSAFIHGYLHGYEDAFHIANLRLYAPQLVFKPPRIDHQDDKAYRSEFGNKKFFLAGYRYGFRSGYADGINRRNFRALNLIQDSLDLKGPSALENETGPDADALDHGLSLGYFAGRKRGLHDGRLREAFHPPGKACDREQSASEAPGFCEGLEQGYRMGYTDGYQNQYTIPARQTASR